MKIYAVLSKLTLLTFMIMAFVVTACKDDDENPAPQVDDNPIVGTWQLTSVSAETPGTIPQLAQLAGAAPCYLDLKLTFKSDNTLTTADCPIAVLAISAIAPVGDGSTWKVNGDVLNLKSGTTAKDFKFTQTPTELTVVANTEVDATKPAVNALLKFKKL
ncbi:lipocalin family protein [Dyadobacter chenwenxiniae]|uniref:Lipocalin family protein n=1 Tax=Dyadobacter chenwenxiniae TaxID=2906456 RepID=A0A9X1PIL9_9BACT|nr:lipocalin family protein [Dyadobacter chenwenxiniae]MCF0062077.1 lipocalin family protein [Dyadobacter chenwenxiniae]UON81883.1 lipocalin family protein [Dyadobacter chenwenxiniae]